MTREHVKQRLNSYQHVRTERRQLLEKIIRLEARLTSPGAQNLDGMPHGSSRGDALANGIAQLSELRDLYRAKEAELAQTQRAIEELIEGLEPIERVIARYRYIDGMQWEQICVKISYSWRQTHRIHSDMIDKLAKELDEAETKATNAMGAMVAQALANFIPSPQELRRMGRMNGRHDGYNPVYVHIDELKKEEDEG